MVEGDNYSTGEQPQIPAQPQQRKLTRDEIEVTVRSFVQVLLSDSFLHLEETKIRSLSASRRLEYMTRLRSVLAEALELLECLKGTAQYSFLIDYPALERVRRILIHVYRSHYSRRYASSAESKAHFETTRKQLDVLLGSWIAHPAQETVLAELSHAYDNTIAGKPLNLFLLGPSTVGKTYVLLLHTKARRPRRIKWVTVHDEQYGELRVAHCPIVFVECPHDGLARSILREILGHLGHPCPTAVKEAMLATRICEFGARCGLRQIIIDDINHSVQVGEGEKTGALRSSQAIFNVAKALRKLAAEIVKRELPISIVLAGVHQAEFLRQNNTQFANQFKHEVFLEPYRLADGHSADVLTFSQKCLDYLSALPLGVDTLLQGAKDGGLSFDLLLKLHWTSNGCIGNMVNLLKDAAVYAMAAGSSKLTEEHISYAYKAHRIAIVTKSTLEREVARANPFVPGFRFPDDTTYARVKSLQNLIPSDNSQH